MNSADRLRIGLTRLLVRTVGRASELNRLCLEHGLTAGKTLDYVYRNQPTGRWLFGRWLDRRVLDHPGWRAVRTRRANLEALLFEAIEALRAAGRGVSLVDIASGPGGYVLAVLERVEREGGGDVTAVCRDLDERWLREGEAEAARRGLGNVRFERGDAFAAEELAALDPPPNLVVASGFYDWLPEDEAVRRSFALICDLLPAGGQLVITHQTAHPDLELAQGVYEGFDHEPLAMRMRSRAEVETWLEAAGFTVERSLADPRGYYSVTRASRRA